MMNILQVPQRSERETVSFTFNKTMMAPMTGKTARMKNIVLRPNISAIIPAIIVPVTAPKVIAELR